MVHVDSSRVGQEVSLGEREPFQLDPRRPPLLADYRTGLWWMFSPHIDTRLRPRSHEALRVRNTNRTLQYRRQHDTLDRSNPTVTHRLIQPCKSPRWGRLIWRLQPAYISYNMYHARYRPKYIRLQTSTVPRSSSMIYSRNRLSVRGGQHTIYNIRSSIQYSI